MCASLGGGYRVISVAEAAGQTVTIHVEHELRESEPDSKKKGQTDGDGQETGGLAPVVSATPSPLIDGDQFASDGGLIELQPMVEKKVNFTQPAGHHDHVNGHGVEGQPQPSPTSIPVNATFPVRISEFQHLFKTETTAAEAVEIIQKEFGGLSGLADKLATDPSNGLDAEMCSAKSQSVIERINMYGENILPLAPKKSFLDFCLNVCHDPMLRILMVAAAISIILGFIEDVTKGWYEGAAIWFAIITVVLVSAANDFNQQKQFAAIDISKELDPVTVIRSGRQFSVPPTTVLVGDLVALAAGQRIPADGILIEMKGKEVKVNESSATGETGLIDKTVKMNPLMMSGTEVVSGSCVMLVVLVGINTSYGQTLASLVEESTETPLQKRLDWVAEMIGWLGGAFALATFLALLGYWISHVAGHSPSTKEWSDLLDIAVVCISIIVVAVPEGLPLAVTVSLAYSMKAMLKDHILVRELAACETMGNATAICSDKTGTLTQNRMTVQRVYLQQQMMDRPPARDDLNPTILHLLEQSIILNSAAWIEDEQINLAVPPQDWKWKDGNQTEISLLAWLIGYGFDINQIRTKYSKSVKVSEAFDSIKKYSSIILEHSPEEIAASGPHDSKKRYRQYFKGAAEAIINQTNSQMNKHGEIVPLVPESTSRSAHENIHKDLLDTVSEFSRRGLRVIAFGFRDLDELPFTEAMPAATTQKAEEKAPEEQDPDVVEDEVTHQPITDAVLIGMVGLSDPLRPTSYRSVRLCQRAGIIVRMVTGDHVETARFISRECGIWTSKQHLCMTGAEFRKMMAEADEETKKQRVAQLRVLARSSPQDKQVLVKFLQSQGEVVAATGDGTNDAPALKAADVGIAMFQSGTAVCKSAADLWLMDDNFASIVAAVVWGRCVFDNIRKFLAFQLTMSVVALFLSLVGAITDYPLPLTSVQLLWINLIMDTAAAVALGTELPNPDELLSRRPKPASVRLVSKEMWYKIATQSSYQLTVLFFLLYKAKLLFPDIIYNSTEHKTLIFNTFTWLQLCNSFNARRVTPMINVFGGFFKNPYFILITGSSMIFQVFMVEFFGSFANTTHQTWQMWVTAFVCGFFAIVMGSLSALLWQVVLMIRPDLKQDDSVDIHPPEAYDGAQLHDPRFSYKRPEGLGFELESSRHGPAAIMSGSGAGGGRSRASSRAHLNALGHQPADGPVALSLNQIHTTILPSTAAVSSSTASSSSTGRITASLSARRANPSSSSVVGPIFSGSGRRLNPPLSFHHHAMGGDHHEGELEQVIVTSAGLTNEQLVASASWPRVPSSDQGASDQSAATRRAHPSPSTGVQVIEELDELI